jgi:IS1 family transposase/transposase-like protein
MKGNEMIHHLLFHNLLLFGLLWLCIIVSWLWLRRQATTVPARRQPVKRSTRRSQDPKLFPGLTTKPSCVACEQAQGHADSLPEAPPPLMAAMRGRPREVDTQQQYCQHATCSYYGWVSLGNIRANGHPSGSRWRQFHCLRCQGYFLETHGTPLHGKHVAPERFMWAVGALAEGLGIRAVARVFEVDPNTVLQWLVEAADQAAAVSQHFLHDVRVSQVQLDELFAVVSAVKAGEVREAQAIARLSRSPHWVWAALDPVTKLVLTIDVGDRTLAMAQGVVHQVAQMVAPDRVPLFLTDGFKEYTTVLLTHYRQWVQPPRKRVQGPGPKPRWMPLPQLLHAQVVKRYRCRRLVGVCHRVVLGTRAAVQQVLAAQGWQINTAFIERVHLTIRQHVAAVGRRVITLCKHEDGLRQQLALYHLYYNFCLPHTSLRVPLPQPEPTNGSGSVRRWQPRTPAMAAGLANRVWTLREVLLFRVPPWPQPQTL